MTANSHQFHRIYPHSIQFLSYQPSIESFVSILKQTQAKKKRGEEAESERRRLKSSSAGKGDVDRERYAKREWYCEKAGDKTGKNPDGQWREISGNIRHGECGDVDLAEIHACRDWSRNSSSDHQPTVNAVERVHDKFNLLASLISVMERTVTDPRFRREIRGRLSD